MKSKQCPIKLCISCIYERYIGLRVRKLLVPTSQKCASVGLVTTWQSMLNFDNNY